MKTYKSMIEWPMTQPTVKKKNLTTMISICIYLLTNEDKNLILHFSHTPIFSCVKTFGISTSYTLTSHFTYI